MEARPVKLSNGSEFAPIGFGCGFGAWAGDGWKGFRPELGWLGITLALKSGYRNFDTSLMYGSHRVLGTCLGQAFATGQLNRSDVFITTRSPIRLGLGVPTRPRASASRTLAEQ